MRGVISLTDRNWFEFLSGQQDLDEVNFWRPTDLSRPSLESGTPFIFKLKAEFGGHIVGYGIFSTHSVQPMWVAWEALERKNGARSFSEFHSLIEPIRRSKGKDADPAGGYEIGCLMLSSPVFLDQADWIRPPADWPRTGVMQGKSYDLSQGEGARVWEECLAKTPQRAINDEPRDLFGVLEAPRFGAPTLMTPRLGQGSFRFAVSDAYGRACAVTGEHSLPVLEAAHIRPYASDGPHAVANGLLLRTDVHRLFDRGYLTVTPDEHRLLVSPRLRSEYKNGKTYYAMEGKVIALPKREESRPKREFLEWHAESVFRG